MSPEEIERRNRLRAAGKRLEELPFGVPRTAVSRWGSPTAVAGMLGGAGLSSVADPATLLRKAQRMAREEAPAVRGPTAVKEPGWFGANRYAISAALGQAAGAIMGPYQQSWQTQLGAVGTQLARGRAYQATVSRLLAGEDIGQISEAEALPPEMFQAAMAVKSEAERDKERKETEFRNYTLRLAEFMQAGKINEDQAERLEAQEAARLGLERERVGVAKGQLTLAEKIERKKPTPEKELELKVDLERQLMELRAPMERRESILNAVTNLRRSVISAGGSEEEADSQSSAFMRFLVENPELTGGEVERPRAITEAPPPGEVEAEAGVGTFASPVSVPTAPGVGALREDEWVDYMVQTAEPGYHRTPDGRTILKDVDGSLWLVDNEGRKLTELQIGAGRTSRVRGITEGVRRGLRAPAATAAALGIAAKYRTPSLR